MYLVVGDTTIESEHEKDERESSLTIMRCFLAFIDCDSWKHTAL